MNFHHFTSPRRGWCKTVAKTCCCLHLFTPVLLWWWDNSLPLDLWRERFLQSSLCNSLLVKLFLQTGLWQFDDIWVHGKVKIWLPKPTVITVNSYIACCSSISTSKGNVSITIPTWQTAKQMEHDCGWARKRTRSSGQVPSPCCISVLVKAAVKVKYCPANHWQRNIYRPQFSVSRWTATGFIRVTFTYTTDNTNPQSLESLLLISAAVRCNKEQRGGRRGDFVSQAILPF